MLVKLSLMLCFFVSCNSIAKSKNQKSIFPSIYSEKRSTGYLNPETKETSYPFMSHNQIGKQDCSETHSSGDDAYSYCRKAYNSDDFEEIKSYLKKAMNSFEEAMSSSEDCKCDDAHSSAEEGYDYAKKGYRNDDIDEMKRYARKAKSSAEDVMSKADDCSKDILQANLNTVR